MITILLFFGFDTTVNPPILDHPIWAGFFAIKIGKCKFFAFFDFFRNRKIPLFSKFVKKISKIFKKENKSKNAKNLRFPIFIAKKGPNRVVKDRKKWSKIGGLTVYGRQNVFVNFV